MWVCVPTSDERKRLRWRLYKRANVIQSLEICYPKCTIYKKNNKQQS